MRTVGRDSPRACHPGGGLQGGGGLAAGDRVPPGGMGRGAGGRQPEGLMGPSLPRGCMVGEGETRGVPRGRGHGGLHAW